MTSFHGDTAEALANRYRMISGWGMDPTERLTPHEVRVARRYLSREMQRMAHEQQEWAKLMQRIANEDRAEEMRLAKQRQEQARLALANASQAMAKIHSAARR